MTESEHTNTRWAAAPEGQHAAFAGLTADTGGKDAVQACADLAARTGAKSFECGYVHENVPPAEAGWYASAMFKGARITEQDKASPAEACDALAVQLLAKAGLLHWRRVGDRWERRCESS